MNLKLLAILLLICVKLNAQISYVNDYNPSYIHNSAGNFIVAFHESNFGHANKPIRVYLMPGEYWLFCGASFSFQDDLEILRIEPSISNLKQEGAKAFSFSLEKETNLIIETSTTVKGLKNSDHLFTFFLKYNPTVDKQIEGFSYTDMMGKVFSANKSKKKYSVILFWGRQDFLDTTLIKNLNKLQVQLNQKTDFLCLTNEDKPELERCQEEKGFNWQLIPNASFSEQPKYMINGLISEPSVYIVDNAESKIVFYYYGLYEIEKVLLSALSTLDQ
jgi:hypothetical protein